MEADFSRKISFQLVHLATPIMMYKPGQCAWRSRSLVGTSMNSAGWNEGLQREALDTGGARSECPARKNHQNSRRPGDTLPSDEPSRSRRRPSRPLLSFVLALMVLCCLAPAAHAQERDPSLPIEPGARGTMGGLFLGAEVVMLTEAIVGVQPVWAYAVGGGAGALGGAIAGYASDQAGGTSLSMGFVVAAIALAVPTTIAVLSATSYRAEPTAESLTLGLRQPHREPTLVLMGFSHSGGTRPPFDLHVSRSPTSFLAEYHQQSLAIGVPDVKVSQVYSKLERSTQRVPHATQVLVPLFRMSF